ncbi:hypothetical protein [Duganella sp. P38]|uniref:hypothetical protein n=1 Tax=Duganella sp. P38 TaxID=3423949 RepID=UPI003D79B0F9
MQTTATAKNFFHIKLPFAPDQPGITGWIARAPLTGLLNYKLIQIAMTDVPHQRSPVQER